MVLSLIATRLIFHELGDEVLGIIYFSVTVTFALIALSDMGISPTISREVAVYRHSEPSYVQDLVRTTSLLLWGVYLLSCMAVYWLVPVLSEQWLNLKYTDTRTAIQAMQLISFSLLLAIPRALYASVINGHERVDLSNVANVAATALQNTGLIAFIYQGASLQQIAYWYVLSSILGIAPFVYLSMQLSGGRSLIPVFHPAVVIRNLGFASRMFANSIAASVTTQVDKWVISRYLPVGQLGYYGFAQGLVSKGSVFPGAIAAAAFPSLSASVSRGHRQEWMSQYTKLQDFCCYLYMPITAAVAMIGTMITRLVFNQEVTEMLVFPLIFLAVGQFLLGTLYIPIWLSYAMNKPEIALRANVWSLLVVGPATIVLTYKWGMLGAAFSSVLYALWQIMYFVPRFCTRCLADSPWPWFRHAGPIAVLGLLTYGVSWMGAWLTGEGMTVRGLIAAYVVGSGLFITLGWLMLGDELKSIARSLLLSALIQLKGGATP